jgi:hypothetical protein
VLVLFSYDSTDWQLILAPGAQIEAVVLSGGGFSDVLGLPAGVPVGQTTPYYANTFSGLEEVFGRPATELQNGGYEGGLFQITNQPE